MTVKFSFLQITSVKEWLVLSVASLFKRKDKKNNTVTQFSSFCNCLAATIGTGNIAGVATAIALSGPGAIFWMWCSALFSMAIGYAENVLGILYRKKAQDGTFVGGAMCYLENGLNSKPIAVLYALLLSVTAFGIGNLVQTNSAALGAVQLIRGLGIKAQTNQILTVSALFLTVFLGIITFGGLKALSRLTEKLVPFMALFYILGCVLVIAFNFDKVPYAFSQIFSHAFNTKSVVGGTVGYTVMMAIRQGVNFGVFSNEAGLGSSVSGHSQTENATPRQMGMWSMFEIFIDTILICTLTALVVLTSGIYSSESFLAALSAGEDVPIGVELALGSFEATLGSGANLFLSLETVLFAVSSVAVWSYYGANAIEYASGKNQTALFLYKLIFVLLIPFGCFFKSAFVWKLGEGLNAALAIPNLIAVCILSGKVKKYNKDYKNGKIQQNNSFNR
ncbi:MAG: alanine:cation symporter family protein [Clostridia bacterium]|nr:alanine:cation symporter family protein [Clostridia bacterium]